MIRVLGLVVLLAACGSNKPLFAPADKVPAGSGSGSGSAANEAAEKHEEMATMPPAVKKFHDVLAPRWHQEQGDKRTSDTCSALPDFDSGAEAIAKATPPTTANADTWTTATKALVDAVHGLDTACASKTDFEAAFAKVHDAFHALLAAAGGHP
jgi:hypothetical protein